MGSVLHPSLPHQLVDPHPEGDLGGTTLISHTHTHNLQSHKEMRGNERLPSALSSSSAGVFMTCQCVTSAPYEYLMNIMKQTNLRCMPDAQALQTNHTFNAQHSTHTHMHPPHCHTLHTHSPIYLAIQSRMGTLQHKGKVAFSKAWMTQEV